MSFIPIPQSAQVCWDFTASGQNFQFCLVLRKNTGTPSTTDLANLAVLATDWFHDHLRDSLSNEVTLRQARATDMTVEGGPQAVNTLGEVGTVAEFSLPLNAATVVSLRTAKRGRSYRGRVYVSGAPESAFDDPTNVTSAFATGLATKFGTLLADIAAAGFKAVIASKQHNGAVVDPATTEEITNVIVDTKIDSQRRRLEGRGT